LQSLIDAGEGPLLVFSDHVDPVEMVASGLKVNCATVTGSTPMGKRDQIARDFQAGLIDVLVATTGTLSVGVTLTASRNVIYNDIPWTPGDLVQSTARIYRISQKRKCCVHYVSWGPIDTMIINTINEKTRVLAEVL
jgi:SNF2 family DNA or RNA helicase